MKDAEVSQALRLGLLYATGRLRNLEALSIKTASLADVRFDVEFLQRISDEYKGEGTREAMQKSIDNSVVGMNSLAAQSVLIVDENARLRKQLELVQIIATKEHAHRDREIKELRASLRLKGRVIIPI